MLEAALELLAPAFRLRPYSLCGHDLLQRAHESRLGTDESICTPPTCAKSVIASGSRFSGDLPFQLREEVQGFERRELVEVRFAQLVEHSTVQRREQHFLVPILA